MAGVLICTRKEVARVGYPIVRLFANE